MHNAQFEYKTLIYALTSPRFGYIMIILEVNSVFQDRLKKLRLARGLSQAQLAEDLGLPQKTYCNYERNEREPSSNTLIKIAAYFGVSLDYLLDYHCDNNEKVPPIIDERDLLRKKLEGLSIKDLEEIDKFMDYLIWKEEQG